MQTQRKIDDNLLLELWAGGNGKSQTELAQYFGCSNAAICKKLKRLTRSPLPESFARLTGKEQRFVLAKAEGKTNIEAVMSSFDVNGRDSAKTLGCRLMKDPDIESALSDLMAQEGISRRHRIRKLSELINHPDPAACARGLDMSFKIGGEYQAEKVIEVNNYQVIIDNIHNLDAEIARIEAEMERLRAS